VTNLLQKSVKKKGGEMKVKIDESLCTGCEICADECPEIFEMGEEISEVKVETVPAELESKTKETAENCPVEAIIIEE